MSQLDFDFKGAKAARDRGIRTVASNSGKWIDQAKALARALPSGWEGTGEDLRVQLLLGGLAVPHHHNVWGALIRYLILRGVLLEIAMSHCRTVKSHARKTPLYRKIK